MVEPVLRAALAPAAELARSVRAASVPVFPSRVASVWLVSRPRVALGLSVVGARDLHDDALA